MMKTNTNFEKDKEFVWPLRDVEGIGGLIEGWRDVSTGPSPITDGFRI